MLDARQRELIKDEYNGLLFKPQDVNDLANKYLYALRESVKMDKIIDNAKRCVAKERSWLNIWTYLMNLSRILLMFIPLC